MNKSFSKIRHIQEANALLEQRRILNLLESIDGNDITNKINAWVSAMNELYGTSMTFITDRGRVIKGLPNGGEAYISSPTIRTSTNQQGTDDAPQIKVNVMKAFNDIKKYLPNKELARCATNLDMQTNKNIPPKGCEQVLTKDILPKAQKLNSTYTDLINSLSPSPTQGPK